MILWFVGTSVATVFIVFRDSRFDYRPLIAGALLPDLVDIWFGGAHALHSVVVAMGTMVLVVLGTIGRRPLRRMLLGVPIGMLLHLVFDGAFSDVDTFWWPVTGEFGDSPLPIVSRGWWNALLELAGALLIAIGWPRFRLRSGEVRRRFIMKGQLTEW
jgi:hypothetical protein